jgi:hypothetical protein
VVRCVSWLRWSDGYSMRFGLYRVNYSDPLRKRVPKASALWYRDRVMGFLSFSTTEGTSSSTAPVAVRMIAKEAAEESDRRDSVGVGVSESGRFTGSCVENSSSGSRSGGSISFFERLWCVLKTFYSASGCICEGGSSISVCEEKRRRTMTMGPPLGVP